MASGEARSPIPLTPMWVVVLTGVTGGLQMLSGNWQNQQPPPIESGTGIVSRSFNDLVEVGVFRLLGSAGIIRLDGLYRLFDLVDVSERHPVCGHFSEQFDLLPREPDLHVPDFEPDFFNREPCDQDSNRDEYCDLPLRIGEQTSHPSAS